MERGGKVGTKRSTKTRAKSKEEGSDESDEDYSLGADEELEDSEEYRSSLAGEDSEESLDEFEEEGKEKEEEEEEEEEEEKARKVGRSKGRKGFLHSKRSEVGKAHRKRKVSYKGENYEDSEDQDYVDDDDDGDDEEFLPDAFDLDYEDELAVRKKNKKVGKPRLRKKGFVKELKRKRNPKVMKKRARKKRTKSRGLQRKPAAGNEGAFTEKNPVVKQRIEKSSRRRKRRFMEDSDSDFMSSGSPDVEYTISEEEREQLREASEFCGDLTAIVRNSSSEKRLQEVAVCQQRQHLGRKGKDKVEDLKNEAGKQVCGICLSEEGKKTVQGTLNCCDHYFCFACIMEWAKVESRCPLCKHRFVTISKPTRSNAGIDLRATVVEVPERDQVYQPSEEELRVYLDPYEHVHCIECQRGGDDDLMLLCDLCDSPSHTYCVGLGCVVPEGNWYCNGCRPTAFDFSNPLASRSSTHQNVREPIDLNTTYVPETPLTQGNGSSPRLRGGDFQGASPLTGARGVTVSERRRVNRIIHQFRTNRTQANALGNSFLASRMGLVRRLEYQHRTPELLASHHTFSQGRLQVTFSTSGQSRDFSLTRSSHSSGHIIRDQTSTSVDRPANGMVQPGFAGIAMSIDSRLGSEQLHPCSSRSSVGDSNTSPRTPNEDSAPARTLQGAERTPF